jgi:hypothetical protein
MTCDLATASCVAPADAGSADAAKPSDAAPTPTDAGRSDVGTKPPVIDAAKPRDSASHDVTKIADASRPRDAAQLDARKVADATKPRDGAAGAPSVNDATSVPPLPAGSGAHTGVHAAAGDAVEGGGCGCELGAARDVARRDYLAWIVALALVRRRRRPVANVKASLTRTCGE